MCGPDDGQFIGAACPAATCWKNWGGGGPYGGSQDYLGRQRAAPSVPYISRDLTPPGEWDWRTDL
jgi:hypothetical protein